MFKKKPSLLSCAKIVWGSLVCTHSIAYVHLRFHIPGGLVHVWLLFHFSWAVSMPRVKGLTSLQVPLVTCARFFTHCLVTCSSVPVTDTLVGAVDLLPCFSPIMLERPVLKSMKQKVRLGFNRLPTYKLFASCPRRPSAYVPCEGYHLTVSGVTS